VEALKDFAEVEAFPIPQELSSGRMLFDHLRSVVFGYPYTRYAYASGDYRRRLVELLRTRDFDLVHLDSLDLSAYLRHVEHLPVACTHHNIESLLLRRRGSLESFQPRRRYFEYQAQLMEREERYWSNRIDVNLVVSPEDAYLLGQLSPSAKIRVVPNGVDTSYFNPKRSGKIGAVFVGGYGWFPNRDGMEFFVRDVLPLLKQQDRIFPITWVGRAPESVRRYYLDLYEIQMTGYVDDVRPFIEDAACYIVPLRTGGGTRLKILDAWAMGKAVVSTAAGCEGLQARDGENILIRDTPQGFAEAVRQVLHDDDLRARLGAAARATAVGVYEWEVIGNSITQTYLELLHVSHKHGLA
jgi:glycosyltransferase involved in cell wall biosynthesis